MTGVRGAHRYGGGPVLARRAYAEVNSRSACVDLHGIDTTILRSSAEAGANGLAVSVFDGSLFWKFSSPCARPAPLQRNFLLRLLGQVHPHHHPFMASLMVVACGCGLLPLR